MAKNYDDIGGVWRTIGGRRVFIKTGQSLSSAMIESGKFKNLRSNYKKAKEEDEKAKQDKEWEEKVKKLEKENAKNKGYELEEKQNQNEKKSIHSQSGDYTYEELSGRDTNVKQMYKDAWEGKISYKELNDKLEDLKSKGKISQGELDSLKYDASLEKKETFTQKSTNPLYPDRDYSKEYLKNYDYEKNMPEGAKFNKMLEESGVRTFADDIKERELRRSESRNQLLQQKIKYANTQKGLKNMVDNDLATDITRYSFEDNEKLRRKHGKLEKIKTVKGVYGTSGALLRSRETGEYFVITARNSNIDYWI